MADESTIPDSHICRLCESPEYETATRLIERGGLNPAQWSFLLHDITFQLRNGLFYSLDTFIPATAGRTDMKVDV